MPDLREVFEMVTQQTEPDLDSWVEQERRLRQKQRNQKLGAYALVAALAIGAIVFVTYDPQNDGRGSTPADQETSAPLPDVLRANGEVLSFRGASFGELGDLIAVHPETGDARVLVEDIDEVTNATWSGDGQWVAYESLGSLWVVDAQLEPREVLDTDPGVLWTWAPSGARLAVIRDWTMHLIDASTGSVTDLASISTNDPHLSFAPDVTSPPVWSPDGTTVVFGARGGALHSVDVSTGDRSLLVRLPGDHLDSMDAISWSPDGSRLAIYNDLAPGDGHLFVLNADGSDVRSLVDDGFVFGLDWSPDGSQIVFTEDRGSDVGVFVALADGSEVSLIASIRAGVAGYYPVWSPDGARIALGHQTAFLSVDAQNLVVDPDGSGDVAPLDDLTYESWRGGAHACDCELFG